MQFALVPEEIMLMIPKKNLELSTGILKTVYIWECGKIKIVYIDLIVYAFNAISVNL